MSLAALAGARAARGNLPGTAGQPGDPAYGLGYRFTVKFDNSPMSDLGAWQSCSGLKVEFKTVEVKRGGDYLRQVRLPDKAVYSKVTLKRAVLAANSTKVQDWLTSAARKWLSDAAPSKGADATITLYDSNDKPVLEWVLHQARPSAWSGPELDATSSKVAIETLELDHMGFEVRAAGAPAKGGAAASGDDETGTAAVPVLSYQGKDIKFSFAPEVLTLEMLGKGHHAPANPATELHLTDVPNYKVSDLILEGGETKEWVTLMAEWATPTREEKKRAKEAKEDPAVATVTFKWGTQFHFTAQIKKLDGKYTRFTAAGVPIRAVVGLTLQIVEDLSAVQTRPRSNAVSGPAPPLDTPGAENPSSGGVPGRASHLLTESDTLPLLSREHYGSPAHWRDIAAANELDDPLRKQPGRLLLLPATTELSEGHAS